MFGADFFHPVGGLAVEHFDDGDVGHGREGCGAVPMLFTRREPDDVTRANFPIGPPQRCTRPQPLVTMSVWPSGCVCHAVRAPGSKVTLAPRARAGTGASNSGLTRTKPVNHSAGPLLESCEPSLLMSIGRVVFFVLVAEMKGRSSALGV